MLTSYVASLDILVNIVTCMCRCQSFLMGHFLDREKSLYPQKRLKLMSLHHHCQDQVLKISWKVNWVIVPRYLMMYHYHFQSLKSSRVTVAVGGGFVAVGDGLGADSATPSLGN